MYRCGGVAFSTASGEATVATGRTSPFASTDRALKGPATGVPSRCDEEAYRGFHSQLNSVAAARLQVALNDHAPRGARPLPMGEGAEGRDARANRSWRVGSG